MTSRAAAGILYLLALIAFMNSWLVGNFHYTRVFVVAFLVDFLIRVAINPRYAPTLILGRLAVRRQAPEWTGAPQKRFAWGIGLALAATMFYLIVINEIVGPVNLFICLFCLLLLFFESAFGICIGCKIYEWVIQRTARHCPGGVCPTDARPARKHGSAEIPEARRRLALALGATWAFAFVEALAGWHGGSLALLADAGHMVTDGAALGLALLAAWIAARPPSMRHSYGLGRVELFAAIVNALTMLAVVAGIVVEAWARFETPRPVEGALVSLVAALGLIVNLGVAWMLAHGQENLNVRGAFLHVLGDLLGSLAAIVAGVVVWLTGWTPIDPLLSLLIGGLVLAASLRLLREAVHGLMDGVPFSIDLDRLGRQLAGFDLPQKNMDSGYTPAQPARRAKAHQLRV